MIWLAQRIDAIRAMPRWLALTRIEDDGLRGANCGFWSHSPEVSFINQLGEEHGFDAIQQNVFEKVMGGMFSAQTYDA